MHFSRIFLILNLFILGDKPVWASDTSKDSADSGLSLHQKRGISSLNDLENELRARNPLESQETLQEDAVRWFLYKNLEKSAFLTPSFFEGLCDLLEDEHTSVGIMDCFQDLKHHDPQGFHLFEEARKIYITEFENQKPSQPFINMSFLLSLYEGIDAQKKEYDDAQKQGLRSFKTLCFKMLEKSIMKIPKVLVDLFHNPDCLHWRKRFGGLDDYDTRNQDFLRDIEGLEKVCNDLSEVHDRFMNESSDIHPRISDVNESWSFVHDGFQLLKERQKSAKVDDGKGVLLALDLGAFFIFKLWQQGWRLEDFRRQYPHLTVHLTQVCQIYQLDTSFLQTQRTFSAFLKSYRHSALEKRMNEDVSQQNNGLFMLQGCPQGQERLETFFQDLKEKNILLKKRLDATLTEIGFLEKDLDRPLKHIEKMLKISKPARDRLPGHNALTHWGMCLKDELPALWDAISYLKDSWWIIGPFQMNNFMKALSDSVNPKTFSICYPGAHQEFENLVEKYLAFEDMPQDLRKAIDDYRNHLLKKPVDINVFKQRLMDLKGPYIKESPKLEDNLTKVLEGAGCFMEKMILESQSYTPKNLGAHMNVTMKLALKTVDSGVPSLENLPGEASFVVEDFFSRHYASYQKKALDLSDSLSAVMRKYDSREYLALFPLLVEAEKIGYEDTDSSIWFVYDTYLYAYQTKDILIKRATLYQLKNLEAIVKIHKHTIKKLIAGLWALHQRQV